MKVSRDSLEVLEQLSRDAVMLITANYEEEEIEDLGKIYRIGKWVRSESHTGNVCYVRTDGEVTPLETTGQLDPLIRHIASQTDEINKGLTHLLSEILNYLEPYEAGPVPENEGRCYVGVRINVSRIDGYSIVEFVEQWFGMVSVDNRLIKIHMKDAGYIGWWLEHSPSIKTPNK